MALRYHYLIDPNPILLELLGKHPNHDLQLDKPLIWMKREDIGPHGLYMPENHIAFVKLLYIIYVKIQLAGSPKYRELQQELLGKPPYTIDIFDKWWSIKRLQKVDGTSIKFTDILSLADIESLKSLAKTNISAVDEWVAAFMALKVKAPRFSFDLFNYFV